MRVKKITWLVAGLFLHGYSYGHDGIHAPEVEVTEERINPLPSATTTIKASKEIDRARLNTNDTAKLLEGEPGISLYQAGGVSSMPVIHGLADDRIRIKVDEMDLISACANHMNTPLSYIDPANVSSIKVYSGVTPVSVGGDSIGGTIKVESAAPEFSDSPDTLIHKGQIGAFYRSNNDARGANFSATLANDSFSARYTGSIVEANNYKAGGNFKPNLPWITSGVGSNLSGDTVGSSAYKSENHALNLAFKRDNHLFDLKLGVQNIPYQGFPNQRMDMTSNESEQINFKYTGEYGWGNLMANVYHESTRHSMDFLGDKRFLYPSNATGMPMDTRGKNTGASLKADIPYSARDLFKVGAEYQRYRLDDWWSVSGTGGMAPNTFENINNGQRDRYDVFAEWEATWSKAWMSQFGLRHSTIKMNSGNVNGYNSNYDTAATNFNLLNHERTDRNLDMTALARLTPDDNSIYEFGYSIKNRSPNLYERYTWSYNSSMAMNMNNWVGDGNGYVGNVNLKPETAHTFSLMGEWHDANHEKWNLRLSPYYSYVQDYIDAIGCSSGYGCPATARDDGFVNLSLANQSARLYGADISGRWLLGSLEHFGAFKASGVINYVNGKNTDTHDDLYNIMPLNAKFALEQKLGGWTNVAEVKLVAEKDDVQEVRKELRTPGYGLLNLYSSYEWKQARFDVGIENVFDKLYYHPLGGAYVGQGSTMMSTSAAPLYGTAVPGMGRSINVGLTLKF